MQIREASKKAGFFQKDYAAIASIAVTDEAGFAADLTDLKAGLLQWKRLRGRSAKTVLITLVGRSDTNAWVKEMTLSAFDTDPELSPLSGACAVNVSILNKGQTAADQFLIGR